MKYFISSLLLLSYFNLMAQQTPAPMQDQKINIIGGTAHIGNGNVINNSILIFEDGKLVTVAEATSVKPDGGKIINAAGKHIYPGFIASNSSLGLIEINAVKASNDEEETGDLIPHVRSLIAYNAESKVVESMRSNGVLLGQISPKGGRISGTSSIVQFDAWNWEDAVIKVDDGIHLNWPRSFTRGRSWMGENPGSQPNKDYQKQIEELNLFMVSSKTYFKGNRSPKNLPMEAMKGLFDGSKKLFIHVEDEKGIIDAIRFKKDHSVAYMVIVGGYQANKVTDLLKQHNIPVLVNHTHSSPNSDDDDYDFPFKLPKILSEAGVLVGIQNGAASNFQTRNLPFYAGQVVGQGLDKEKALQLITSNTAKILGIEKQYGTLEVGKSATLFISEGDALDMRTNKLSHAFIDGRNISLETHQTKLYKRYKEKYSK